MPANYFMFTLWDVEHGLAIWIQTPNGHHHFIDVGHNNVNDFCPYAHMREHYKVGSIDYLIISHPDHDHIEGLPNMLNTIGEPRVFTRNKSYINTLLDDQSTRECVDILKNLHMRYSSPLDPAESPQNHNYNGGVHVTVASNVYEENMKCNNTSVVAIYTYQGFSFICPGDIEPCGWNKLMENGRGLMNSLEGSRIRILVAPHHGRKTAYSQDMIDSIKPHIILISDKYGKEETDDRYYKVGIGVNIDGEETRCISTKTKGRIRFKIGSNGACDVTTNKHIKY